MYYTGKDGYFIYVPQTKQRIDVGYGENAIKVAIAQIKVEGVKPFYEN